VSTLLAIDPGRAGLGWAFFQGKELRALGVVKQPKGPRDYVAASLEDVAANAVAEIESATWSFRGELHFRELEASCTVERMHYARGWTKDPNDLLDLQAIGGMVAAALCPLSGIRWKKEGQWKQKQDMKRVVERLVSENEAKLSPEELSIVLATVKKHKSLAHNGIAALGIGLETLGRWRAV
jgi:hypothetical protein